LAAFAREELGRWKILLDCQRKVLGGARFTVKEIQSRCEDHVAKQKAGMLSLTFRSDRDTRYGKLLQRRMTASPGSAEWKETEREIQKLDRLKKRRVPDDRHSQRTNALYVDIASSDQWNRPSKTVTSTDAFNFLQDAANDYAVQFDRYTNLQILEHVDSELFEALQQWTDRPQLPLPDRPVMPEMAVQDVRPKRPRFILSAIFLLGVIVLVATIEAWRRWAY
jgi:AbiV family abortive infection protein